MTLERMLAGLQERREKVRRILIAINKEGGVDDGGDTDRLLRRFVVALENVLVEIDRGGESAKQWFGGAKDGDG